jgi:hypothetical protein
VLTSLQTRGYGKCSVVVPMVEIVHTCAVRRQPAAKVRCASVHSEAPGTPESWPFSCAPLSARLAQDGWPRPFGPPASRRPGPQRRSQPAAPPSPPRPLMLNGR